MIGQWKRWMITMGVFCMLCFGISGCGDKNSGGSNTTEEVMTPATEEPDETKPEGEAEPDTEEKEGLEGEGEHPSEETPDAEKDLGEPNLSGTIKEVDGTQFTVVEDKTEKTEDGDIMIAPAAGGDDADFAKVLMVCDKDTIFYTRTIYDGGERYEDSDAVIEDLTEGVSVKAWGSYEEDILYAKTVQITKVVF